MAEELAAHTSGAPLRGALLCGRGCSQDGLQHLGLKRGKLSARLRHTYLPAQLPSAAMVKPLPTTAVCGADEPVRLNRICLGTVACACHRRSQPPLLTRLEAAS